VTALLGPAMKMPSHAGDGAVGATWPWRGVDAESS
jgi:hypothetical protein